MLFALLPAPASLAANRPPLTPADVYTDFVDHGYLTHQYPRSVLQAIIDDAALNQYGDPLVMLRLRLAVRQQLAGLPSRPPRPATAPPPSTTGTGPAQTPSPSSGTLPPRNHMAKPKPQPPLQPAAASGLDIVPIAGAFGAIGLFGSSLLAFTLRVRRRRPGRDS
ncbi:MAG TPA: hypothetical protein VFM96_07340 [Gaiellaceae bacterium]|nr:hypothetical protein [Gaiellaceae bacterium]